MNSLDEQAVSMLKNIIQEEKARGAIILISSHSKEDLISACDEIYLMNEGTCAKLGAGQ